MKAKLISMTDFVLEQNKKLKNAPDAYDQYCKIVNYAQFLKQPLKLEMFVPRDADGNVLEEKSIFNTTYEDYIFDSESFDKYQQAKENVLFEDFEFFDNPKNCLNNMLGDYGVFKYGDGLGITTHEKGKGYRLMACSRT